MVDNTFSHNNEIKQKLSSENGLEDYSKNDLNLTIKDIKHVALLRFGSVASFGRKLGVTLPMASRLLSGGYIPLKAKSIHRIAEALGIDPVILTQIYGNIRGVKND